MHFSLALFALFSNCVVIVLSGRTFNGKQILRRELNRGHDSVERHERQTCTPANTRKIREWRSLSKAERRSYTNAVLCLRNKPSLYKEVSGCNSRYDDFQVLHIQKTFIIHYNAMFLPWHRWFTWTYDKALRDECSYRGSQPYWDWTLDAANIEASPLFDGSPYSLSGNGLPTAGRPNPIALTISLHSLPLLRITLPTGTGGGCVTTGPFANITIPFGPVIKNNTIDASLLDNPKNLEYRPHCLKRDLNPKTASTSLTQKSVDKLLQSPNIAAFIKILDQGPDSFTLDVHAGGHYSNVILLPCPTPAAKTPLGVGADMIDAFASPGDPMFFLHHAQIDRLWTLWQHADLSTRQYALSGTRTYLNWPPSPVGTLEDFIDLGKLSPGGSKVRELMSTMEGRFCYEYV